MIELDLVAHMMFVGELIDVTGCFGIGYEESRLGKGVRGPDVSERSAAAIGDPQAGILTVPSFSQIGVGCVVIVVGVGAAAVTAEEAHVVNE